MGHNTRSAKAAQKTEAKNLGGRPPFLKPEFVEQARKLCALGAIDLELADFFNVCVNTIGNWRRQHPEFARAIMVGKDEADERVVKSLYQRATGYSYDAVKIFCNKDGTVTEVEYREHMPPEMAAIMFWLKNRRPNQWRERSEIEISRANYFIKDAPLTREEWEKRHAAQHPGPDRYLGAPDGSAASAD
jgi:hypothetical protein